MVVLESGLTPHRRRSYPQTLSANALEGAEVSNVAPETSSVSYDTFTKTQLKAELDSRGIAYEGNATNAELRGQLVADDNENAAGVQGRASTNEDG